MYSSLNSNCGVMNLSVEAVDGSSVSHFIEITGTNYITLTPTETASITLTLYTDSHSNLPTNK